MNNFFCNHKTQKSDPEHTFSEIDINYRRDYSKGKSFKVSIWNEIDTYNNDDFIQDFVIYNQSLWARIDSTPSTNEAPTEGPWAKVMDGVSDVQFKEEGNKIFWKYEDESEWKDLFELDVVSESEIKNMLKDIAANVDPNFYDETLSETSVNAVQNKVITQALNKKADKTELSKKQDVISDLSEIRDKANSALQSVPSEYVTESELANKGYLTEHQDISGKQDKIADLAQIRTNAQKGATALQFVPEKYATKTYVSNEVAKIVNSAPKAFDTLKEIADWIEEDAEPAIVLANKVEQKADKTDVAEALAKKADKTDLEGINKSLVFNVDAISDEEPIFSIDSAVYFSTEQVEKAVGMSFEELWKCLEEKSLDLLYGSIYYGITYGVIPFDGAEGCAMHYQIPDANQILCLNIIREPLEVEAGVFARAVLSSMEMPGVGTLTAEEVSSTEPTAEFPQLLYTAQELSEAQKEQARENIGVSEAIEEAIAEIPTAESSVFKAVYGVTTYEEVLEAYNAGKVVHCDNQNACYVMSSIAATHIFFSIINANYSNRIYVRADSTWAQESTVLEQTTNKVKTISEASTDTQYPSAKAVYDLVQDSIFNALNADYYGEE